MASLLYLQIFEKMFLVKNKRLFWIFTVVMIWMTWSYGFKKTIDEYHGNRNLTEQLDEAKEISFRLNSTKAKQMEQGKVFGAKVVSNNEIQQSVLQVVDSFKTHGVQLQELPALRIFEDSLVSIQTHKIVLKGSFIPLLKAVNSLEKKPEIGRVISTTFATKQNLESRKDELTATLYLQNYYQSK